jgi:predicted PurR-regulated permease PerM
MRSVERQLTHIRKPGLRRGLAVILTLVIFVMAIAFVFLLLVPQIQITVESIVATLPEFVRRETANLMAFLDENPEIKDWVLEYTQLESIDWAGLVQKIVTIAGEYLSKIFDSAFSAIGSVTSGIVNGFLGICFAFYALARKEILARQCRRLLYSLIPESWADEIIRVTRLTNSNFSNFISGQCLEACILGSMFALVMWIMDLPYIPLVSVVIAVTALVPLVGAFAGCILGALFILVESPVQAFTFVIVFLVLQQIEGNLIYPRVVGTSIGLPGMWVLVALTVGGEMGGIMGMLVMIPLTSVIYQLLRKFTNARVTARNIPADKLRDHPPKLKSKFKENRERKKEQRLLKRMKEMAEKHAHDLGKKKN